MANLLDYLQWRGDLTFEQSPYNDVDISIISQLSLIDLQGLIPQYPKKKEVKLKKVSENYFKDKSEERKKIGLIIPSTILELLKNMKDTMRFKSTLMSNYFNLVSEETEEQISAFTIKINDEYRVISFSGTDDTIIGWKENLNMIYKSPVPAQLRAVKYIEDMLEMYNEKFIICGHSKGGNMALYGGTNCNEIYEDRIVKIYNFDGPGIVSTSSTDNNYLKRLDKVITIIPQSSTVGRLFEHEESCQIVHSNEVGFYQHDALSWEVLGCNFVIEKELTKESKAVDERLKTILDEMDIVEKEKFVDGLYNVMAETKAKNLTELVSKKKDLTKAYLKLPKNQRRYIINPIIKLLADKTVFKFFYDTIKEYRIISKKK